MVKIGDKIKLISLAKDPNTKRQDPGWNITVKKGDIGTVDDITEAFEIKQIWIKFENGTYLALVEGMDSYEVITK